MKVGIITYHASHNYGSMLQAYALQQTVLSFGHKCEIINFRTKRQKDFYRPFFRKSLRGFLKAVAFPKLAIGESTKHKLFEKFIHDYLIINKKEYSTNEELMAAGFDYDVYISGSDQIWNTHCFDYDIAYFLDFVGQGKKVAYAPSMGPKASVEVDKCFFESIRSHLAKYDSISVREAGTADFLNEISNIKAPTVLDPTLLLPREKWEELAGDSSIVCDDRYIFLYTPWYDEGLYEEASKLADCYSLKVVTSTQDGFRKWSSNSRFEFYLPVGPLEFLNLVRHSEMVVSASFHAVAFAIIFAKPFYAFRGLNDSRISSILTETNLTDLSINPSKAFIDSNRKFFNSAYSALDEYRYKSISFLNKCL